MKKNLFFSSFFCIMLMMTGCSSAVEITADLMPMATTDYPDYIEMTSPETEKIKPTFPLVKLNLYRKLQLLSQRLSLCLMNYIRKSASFIL